MLPKKEYFGGRPFIAFFRTFHRLIKVVCNQPEDVVDIKLKIKKNCHTRHSKITVDIVWIHFDIFQR